MDLNDTVSKAKEKDAKAFASLYAAYHAQMLGVCMNIIREDKQAASDLVHDAFILAFLSMDSLKDNSRFGEWLTTIVRNVSLKYVSRREREHLLSVGSLREDDAVFAASAPSPEEELYYQELLQLISRLPEGYSKVLRLSAVEGFSHQEIAEMLGIGPHSSSSQLSRAKRLLRQMMDRRTIGVMALLLLPLVSYLVFRQKESPLPDSPSSPLPAPPLGECLIPAAPSAEVLPPPKGDGMSRNEKGAKRHREEHEEALDSAQVISPPDISEDVFIAEAEDDSVSTVTKDSIAPREVLPHIDIAEDDTHVEERKWQISVGGSFGQTSTQSEGIMLATNTPPSPSVGSGVPEPDAPTFVIPDYINTWEDYARYLRFLSSSTANIPADTVALITIADHNTGEMVQREHHDVPITFSFSLSKQIAKRWSIETGLQYSLLKSRFQMGENGYSVSTRQQAHYLGVPFRASYRWLEYRNLSAYSSLGVTLHIPLAGSRQTQYTVGWQSLNADKQYFTPALQWQTGVSFGLQYRIAPHTSLFAEPSFNWFIPNGSETHTSWTEHPFMFTCPFGVRVSW